MVKESEFGDYIYDLDDLIGQGQYGKVYGCRSKLNPSLRLCMKIVEIDQNIKPESDQYKKSEREVVILKDLIVFGNQNTVKVEYAEIINHKIVIILERCDGDLQQLLRSKKEKGQTFTPDEALQIIKQIINGYKPLFCNNLIHRDIKPANILYKGDVFKIADFGFARIMDKKMTFCGTPRYAAPQIFHEPVFTNSADIYSIGIMFHELIYGVPPYTNYNNKNAIANETLKIKNHPIKVDRKKPGITDQICDLLESMLIYCELKRIGWIKLFDHPLIQQKKQIKSLYYKPYDEKEANEKIASHQQQAKKIPTTNINIHLNDTPQGIDYQAFTPGQAFTQGQAFTPGQAFTQGQAFTPGQAPFAQKLQFAAKPIYKPTEPVQKPLSQFPQNEKFQPFFLQKYPVQTFITQKVSFPGQSDQLFNIGLFLQFCFDIFSKYINLREPISKEFMDIKLQLYYLAFYFFEHSKAQKQQITNQGTIPISVVQNELSKQNEVQKLLQKEISYYHIPHQIQPIQTDFSKYQQNLLKLYQQERKKFIYQQEKRTYLEYIQLVFIFEKFLEIEGKIKNIIDFSNYIQKIQNDLKDEQKIRKYINEKRGTS